MNYEQMSIEELEAENIRLSNERADIQKEQRMINDVLSRKVAMRDAQAKFAGLSDVEKAALAQVVGVETVRVSGQVNKAGE